MSYYDEDFYNEPSEYDAAVEQLKRYLMDSVKEEYKAEMEKLRAENESLQEIKKNYQAIQDDFAKAKRELEYEYETLKRKVKRKRLSELMEDKKVVLYKADYDVIKPPKCDMCNERRQIKYKTPLGKDAFEDCTCNKGIKHFKPVECILYEFRLDGRDGNELIAFYRVKEWDSHSDFAQLSDSSICATDNIYKEGENFEDMNIWSTFFKSEEECQRFCEYLDKKSI